jgi:hypothetical protein
VILLCGMTRVDHPENLEVQMSTKPISAQTGQPLETGFSEKAAQRTAA